MISENPHWVKRLTDLQVCQFVTEAPFSVLASYGLMVSALRELHVQMTVRDSEINIDAAIEKGLLTFEMPEGFMVTNVGRFIVMTKHTSDRAWGMLDHIDNER